MNLTEILTAVGAIAKLLSILFTKQQAVETRHLENQDELKEEMHRALLAGDNSSIVMCFNRYAELRAQSKAGN